ncbi:MAG: hypothetical protein HUJ71_03060 [Pseudobutyrivibrio sp.]|nr:hypothetical protein [Pseudobutyrivibrio sp.]
MRKRIVKCLAMTMLLGVTFTACGNKAATTSDATTTDEISTEDNGVDEVTESLFSKKEDTLEDLIPESEIDAINEMMENERINNEGLSMYSSIIFSIEGNDCFYSYTYGEEVEFDESYMEQQESVFIAQSEQFVALCDSEINFLPESVGFTWYAVDGTELYNYTYVVSDEETSDDAENTDAE